jgi:hypothetical protein
VIDAPQNSHDRSVVCRSVAKTRVMTTATWAEMDQRVTLMHDFHATAIPICESASHGGDDDRLRSTTQTLLKQASQLAIAIRNE